MAVNVLDNATTCKLLHFQKAKSPTAANVAGNAISCKLLHLAKAPSPMAANVSGNVTTRKLLHPQKAKSPRAERVGEHHLLQAGASGEGTLTNHTTFNGGHTIRQHQFDQGRVATERIVAEETSVTYLPSCL
jgi:hypothetical protein